MSNVDNKHTEAPKSFETFYVGEKGKEQKATITEDGKISIGGKTYSVQFNRGDEATKLTVPQQRELAARVLHILQNTGKNFETLNKMSIQNDKIVHYTGKGKAQTLEAGKNTSWATTAQKTFDRFNRIINKNSDNPFEDDSNDESDSIHLKEHDNGTKFIEPIVDMPIKQEGEIILDKTNIEPIQGNKGNDLKIELVKRDNREVAPESISINEKVQVLKEPLHFGVPLDMQMGNHKLSNKVIRFVELENQPIPNKTEGVSPQPIKDPQVQRQEISSLIISRSGSPQQLAKGVVKSLGSEIEQKIKNFKEAHPEKVKYLQEKGWVAAKEEFGSKMDMAHEDPDGKGVSFAQFRDEANKFVHSLVNELAVQLGVGETDTKIFGTPGYKSDKDISLVSKDSNKPLTTEDMVLLKSVADMLTTEVVGVLPGTALDTEWYVELKFMGKEVQGEAGVAKLATLDMAMSIVQAKEGLKNDEKGWNEFKNRDLEQSTQSVKVVKEQLYGSVEKFYESIEEGIDRELVFQESLVKNNGKRNPIELRQEIDEMPKELIQIEVKQIESSPGFDKKSYNAKVMSQYSKLMDLGEKCGQLEKEIEGLKQMNSPDQNVIDQKIIEHDILYALINSRQPEGTMSSSELATTLFSSLGQQPTRSKEKATVEGKEILSKVSPKDLRGKGLQKAMEKYGEVENKREMGKPYEISQLILAGQERLGQFVHVISHEYSEKDLINGGKYCLRVAESNYFALKKIEKQGLPKQTTVEKDQQKLEEFKKLLNEAESKYFEAKQLEQSKRKFNLNALSTGELLTSRLKELKMDNVNVLQNLAPKLKEFEGTLANESISKEEKLSTLCVFLGRARCLNKDNSEMVSFAGRKYPLPKDFQLRTILQAYAGYDRKDFEQGAGGATLKRLTDSLNNKTSNNVEDVLPVIIKFQEVIQNQLIGPLKEKISDFNILLKRNDLKPEQRIEYKKQFSELNGKLKKFDEVIEGLENGKKNPPENLKEKLLDLGKDLQKEIVEGEVGRINDLQKKGEEIVVKNTIENHGTINKFAEGVEGFSRKVQNFMFDNEFMPKLVSGVEIFDPWLK